jgi:hypothetical protein
MINYLNKSLILLALVAACLSNNADYNPYAGAASGSTIYMDIADNSSPGNKNSA